MRDFRKIAVALATLALAASAAPAAWAADLAVLQNGFSIRHERREVQPGMTRLYTTVNGRDYVDVPTEQILRFEHDDTPSPARAAPATADVLQLVNNASDKHQLDADFIQSVIRAESGFNVRAVSPKGARGLMQLMPGTASKLGVRDSFDPAQNIEGGTRYLRELLQEYNNDMIKALAAYNAGPHRVEQYRGVPPYRETHAYVARIVRDFNAKKLAQRRAQKLAQNKQRAGVQASAASTARAAP